jgi:hypothetical protein
VASDGLRQAGGSAGLQYSPLDDRLVQVEAGRPSKSRVTADASRSTARQVMEALMSSSRSSHGWRRPRKTMKRRIQCT